MSNNKQSSSVDWLIDQLEKHYIKTDLKNTVAYQQSKAHHKEQQMNTFKQAQILMVTNSSKTAEQYYNETFNNEQTN